MIEINTILLLLLAHLFVQFLFKPSQDILACGIWGTVSKTKKWDALSKFKFELLGVENDVRGKISLPS